MPSGIYRLTNKVNGKSYIGQSIDIERRWGVHKRHTETTIISKAIAKYGWDSFSHEILIICNDLNDLNFYEEKLINIFATRIPNGYNAIRGGRVHHIPLLEETKRKLSIAQKNSPAGIANRKAIADRRRGKPGKSIPHTEESKRKLSEAHKRNPGNHQITEQHKKILHDGQVKYVKDLWNNPDWLAAHTPYQIRQLISTQLRRAKKNPNVVISAPQYLIDYTLNYKRGDILPTCHS